MQAARFECLSFDPFPLLSNGFVTSEVDVRRRDVVQALVVALVIIMIDEGFDLRLDQLRQVFASPSRLCSGNLTPLFYWDMGRKGRQLRPRFYIS